MGKLSREQFSLAMYLIQQKVTKGLDPPQALTPDMIPPSEKGTPGPVSNIVNTHTYTHTHKHTHLYTHTHTHTIIHLYTHSYTHTYSYTYTHTHTYKYPHKCMYVCVYAHTYTSTKIHYLLTNHQPSATVHLSDILLMFSERSIQSSRSFLSVNESQVLTEMLKESVHDAQSCMRPQLKSASAGPLW